MLEIQTFPIDQVKANPRNARTHSKKQIRQIAKSIQVFGFVNGQTVEQVRQTDQWSVISGRSL